MTKEEKREYNRKYRELNKEKLAAKRTAYYLANKEERLEYAKKHREANRDMYKASSRKYRLANKEVINAKNKLTAKKYKDAQKDGLYTVYYLKEDHYVGMTTILQQRLCKHKTVHNRHIKDVEIIGKYQTKAGALKVEAALHSMGYLGRHSKLKQQTLKQLI